MRGSTCGYAGRFAVFILACLLPLARPASAAPKRAAKPSARKPNAKPAARKPKAHPPAAHAPTARLAMEARLRRLALEKAYTRSVDQLNKEFVSRRAALDKERKKPDYKRRSAVLQQDFRRQRAVLETAYQKRVAAIQRGGDGRFVPGHPAPKVGAKR